MKKISIKSLKEGMMFSAPLHIDEETIILQTELPLKQKEIDLLTKWDIEYVFTDGELITKKKETEYSDTISLISKVGLSSYLDFVERLDDVFADIKTDNKVTHNMVDPIVKDIIEELDNNKNNIIQFVLMGGKNINKLSANSVNTAILSTIIGKHLKMLSFRLMHLTTGALLHDIGLLFIPEELLNKKEKLKPEELLEIRKHPAIGYKKILRVLKYPEDIANCALFHQERWDGKGIPKGLKGEEIPLSARIISVSESYEAMVNKRPYRNQMIGYKAMKTILGDNGRRFDPNVIKAFISCMGIFPIGSLVLLNNSSIGKITAIDNIPMRPKIEIIVDEYGDKIKNKQEIDLSAEKDLFIVKPIDPHEIEELHGEY